MKKFDINDRELTEQYADINYIENSGLNYKELEEETLLLEEKLSGEERCIIKARTFELILTKGAIAIDKKDVFQEKVAGKGIMRSQFLRWESEACEKYLKEKTKKRDLAGQKYGTYKAVSDYGHTSPNSKLLLEIGFVGLLDRIREHSKKENLSKKQKSYYLSCDIVLSSIIAFAKRMSDATREYNSESADALLAISQRAPKTSLEAMQTLILYFFLHDYVAGTRVRTLGRLDVLLYPFYQNDIKEKRLNKEEYKELLKFFLHKFWAAKVPFDLPFCLSGIDESGEEVTSELSYLIVETYDEMNIYSPKIHIRVSDKTPPAFIKAVLKAIRKGNSSFVFTSDAVAIKSLVGVGISEEHARNYVPIGCYEPAVWGMEIGCTGNGGVNLPKALELVLTRGRDLKSGELISVDTGSVNTFEKFLEALKKQIAFLTEEALDFVREIEKYYHLTFPDPLLSSQYDESVERGVDVYEGGAKYNNSSMYFYSIATLVDSVMAVKRLVFDDKLASLEELFEILKNNWEGRDDLRNIALKLPEKYGNNNPDADAMAVELSEFFASITNNQKNSRGGVFKAALFTTDFHVFFGKFVMATPDGRLSGEPTSKNLCASLGMDRRGVTALICSVTKLDLSKFPTGSVLDIVLHPSAVSENDGLHAFYSLVATYLKKGGFAIHANVFDANDLKLAQKYPERYKNLQVRVCGWNAYFVHLSRVEQDAFIKQAEDAEKHKGANV